MPPHRSIAQHGHQQSCSPLHSWPTHPLCTPYASGKRDRTHLTPRHHLCLPKALSTIPVKRPAQVQGFLPVNMSFRTAPPSKHAAIRRWIGVEQTRTEIRIVGYWLPRTSIQSTRQEIDCDEIRMAADGWSCFARIDFSDILGTVRPSQLLHGFALVKSLSYN